MHFKKCSKLFIKSIIRLHSLITSIFTLPLLSTILKYVNKPKVTKIFRMNCFKIAKEKFTYRTDFSRNFIRELGLSLVISGALRIILLHIPDLKLRIDITETYVDVAADFLSQKLNWLRQSPGGLKLNPQLTGFLTQLCYHHIMIWQNYAKHVLFQIDNYGHCVLYCSYFSIPFSLGNNANLCHFNSD